LEVRTPAFRGKSTTYKLKSELSPFRESKIDKVKEFVYKFHNHSETEDRWVTMGISEKGRLLIVSHTFRKESDDAVTIRIISTRKATRHETASYGEST
jgi:uncharacterized DUF497 family protein